MIYNAVVALMKCTGINSHEGLFKNEKVVACEIQLHAQYTDDEKMREYCDATPSGELKLNIANPAAVRLFEPGKYYKITIEEHLAD